MQISGAMRVAGDIDQQVAEQPVDEPRRDFAVLRIGDLGERDFELVDALRSALRRRAAPGSSGR